MTVRRVIGKRVVDLDDARMASLTAGYSGVMLDLGTGDGKHAVMWARAHPDRLVVAVDASLDALRKRSLQMAKDPDKGGQPNLLFVWASAEQIPEAITDVAEVHVLMPWGSLLRGVLEPDSGLLATLATRCRPDAKFTIVVNRHPWHPEVPEVAGIVEPTPEDITGERGDGFRQAGWMLDRVHVLRADEIAAFSTSWTSRLKSSRETLDAIALEGRIQPAMGR